ncbi:MAG: hypothetical protein ACN6N9_17945 [Chryseobacterium joostei]
MYNSLFFAGSFSALCCS